MKVGVTKELLCDRDICCGPAYSVVCESQFRPVLQKLDPLSKASSLECRCSKSTRLSVPAKEMSARLLIIVTRPLTYISQDVVLDGYIQDRIHRPCREEAQRGAIEIFY